MSNKDKDGGNIFDIRTGKRRNIEGEAKINLENIETMVDNLRHFPDTIHGQYNYVPQKILDALINLKNKSDQELITMANESTRKEWLYDIYFYKALIEELKKRELIS